ncbi:MAG: helix-turn-helix domain-containing protein [Ruminococcaceae bacterium]|nr:helix-turn-helix domain-containing protein [Oscillospiraceae bacterium]
MSNNLWIMWKQKGRKIFFAPLYVIRFEYPRSRYYSKLERFKRQYPTPDTITYTGDKLKYYRYERGIQSKDVAAFAGIDRDTYRSYEKDTTYYRREVIEKIAQLLDVEVHELLDDYNRFIYDGQGKKIKMIRKSFGMTQYEFAEYIGVLPGTLKQWEQERTRISKKAFLMLMEISNK